MSALLVEVNGAVVPLTRCSWYFAAPCGCVHGVMVAQLADERYSREAYATAEQAWAHFTPNRVQRERDKAAGETVRLGLTSDAKELVALDCTHTPRWGREKTPVPDGHTWACTDRSPRTKHLVPGETPPDDARGHWVEPMGERRPTLCKRTSHRYWRADRYDLGELPECLSCAAKAKEWHETHVAVASLETTAGAA